MYSAIKNYLGCGDKMLYSSCPKILKYQFSDAFRLKVSDECCKRLKVEPLEQWMKENGKTIKITGIMREEGGRRMNAKCIAFAGCKVVSFQPMAILTKEWETWFIEKFGVRLCELYEEPYNFERTGCKGCPFALHLQNELDMLEKFLPSERNQCEILWKPVYDEYRRLGCRIKEGT